MRAGVIGLGLIGASFAKALKRCGHEVYGFDVSKEVCRSAIKDGAIKGIAEGSDLTECDLLIIALYPEDTVKFLSDNAHNIKKGSMVVDCAGVKRPVCSTAHEIAVKNGFVFVGGHPMAGKESSGYFSSDVALFNGASMLLTPLEGVAQEITDGLEQLFLSLGFAQVKITTPEEHDRIIAYTSQLAHIVSSSYIKSDTALKQKGFSAGSFKDMTRVAFLNEEMWTELFLDNRDNLIKEIDILQKHLDEYKEALNSFNQDGLKELLKQGRLQKQNSDK